MQLKCKIGLISLVDQENHGSNRPGCTYELGTVASYQSLENFTLLHCACCMFLLLFFNLIFFQYNLILKIKLNLKEADGQIQIWQYRGCNMHTESLEGWNKCGKYLELQEMIEKYSYICLRTEMFSKENNIDWTSCVSKDSRWSRVTSLTAWDLHFDFFSYDFKYCFFLFFFLRSHFLLFEVGQPLASSSRFCCELWNMHFSHSWSDKGLQTELKCWVAKLRGELCLISSWSNGHWKILCHPALKKPCRWSVDDFEVGIKYWLLRIFNLK